MQSESTFQFSKEQLIELRKVIQAYFLDEFETEISNLQADFFIDFLSLNVGKHYYNLGVSDTIESIKEKTLDLVLLMKN